MLIQHVLGRYAAQKLFFNIFVCFILLSQADYSAK